MHLPLEFIAAILLIVVYGSTFTPDTQPPSLSVALLAGGGMVVMLYAAARAGSAWSLHRLRKLPEERGRVHDEHSRAVGAERALLVISFWAFLHSTGWAVLVIHPRGLDASTTVIGDDLLAILPFLLGSLAVWLGNYPASRSLGRAEWRLAEYLRHQARGSLFLMGPWLLMSGVADSQMYWPRAAAELYESSALVQFGLFVAVLGTVGLLFPLYLIHLWPASRLPDGPLRQKMAVLLDKARLGYRDLMVWDTGRGRMPNAAVMGLAAPFRYIVFTDALLDSLESSEIEAVLGHEIGHVRYRHMTFYMLFVVAFAFFAATVFSLLPAPVFNSTVLVALVSILTFLFYWRVVFGFLSRRFERQADLASCDLVGSPLPLMTALEKLAAASGGTRRAGSWRHYSVAERVAYLSRFGFDREALEEYHGYVRQVKIGALIIALLLAANLVREGTLLATGDLQIKAAALEAYLKDHEEDYEKRALLGEIRLRQEEYAAAQECFHEVVRLHPSSPEGYMGLARLRMNSGAGEFYSPREAVKLARKAEEQAGLSVEKTREDLAVNPGGDLRRKRLIKSLKVLAEAAFLAENHEQAVKAAGEALRLSPGSQELEHLLIEYRAARRAAQDD